MTQRSTMPTDARNTGQGLPDSEPLVVVHDKGETRKMAPSETPRERMARVVKTVKKKQKKR